MPDVHLMQVIFSDDIRLDGYPLHRVSNGIIFRKNNYFRLNVGVVFIPYYSMKMIAEPSIYGDGGVVFSNDYPGILKRKEVDDSQQPIAQKTEKVVQDSKE